jgi:mannose-6-phosphate isomerase-like protein (cupin superfamily)
MDKDTFAKTDCPGAAEQLSEFYAPRIVASINDHFVKIVKIKGDKVPWHHHDNSDELFYVLEGEMMIEIESKEPFTLKTGELFVIRRNKDHRVSSKAECRLMLIEHKATAHTGNVTTEITKSIDEQFNA